MMGKIKDFFIVKLESLENESLRLTPGVKRKSRDDDDENEDGGDARDAEDERRSSDLVPEQAPNGAQSFPKKIRGDKTVSSQWAWFMGDGQRRKGMNTRKPQGNKKVGGLVDLGN